MSELYLLGAKKKKTSGNCQVHDMLLGTVLVMMASYCWINHNVRRLFHKSSQLVGIANVDGPVAWQMCQP
ncbi:hypothetical protein K449DRAFT_177267 [Hypoxylon sp. EC38]|nr:hypothetical protein K449DRAFT_177267 [Hypoxylon sp. EC38]